MGQITVTVHGRAYDLVCGDDDERHVKDLARYVDHRIAALAEGLRSRRSAVDEGRMLLMTCLTLADELSEALADREPTTPAAPSIDAPSASPSSRDETALDAARIAAAIEALAERINAVATELTEA